MSDIWCFSRLSLFLTEIPLTSVALTKWAMLTTSTDVSFGSFCRLASGCAVYNALVACTFFHRHHHHHNYHHRQCCGCRHQSAANGLWVKLALTIAVYERIWCSSKNHSKRSQLAEWSYQESEFVWAVVYVLKIETRSECDCFRFSCRWIIEQNARVHCAFEFVGAKFWIIFFHFVCLLLLALLWSVFIKFFFLLFF